MKKRIEIVKAFALFVFIMSFFLLNQNIGIQGQVTYILLFALLLWSLYPDYHLYSSILIILLLALFQISLSPGELIDSLFNTYGGSGLWVIITGFILSEGMKNSGLAQRIALWIITGLGGDPKKVLLSIALGSLFISPLSPSTTAKAFIILPICLGILKIYNAKMGSRFGTSVMMLAMASNNICSTAFLTATVPNPISAAYIAESIGLELTWAKWFVMAFPFTVLAMLAAYLICIQLFSPEDEVSDQVLPEFRKIRMSQDPITRQELIIGVLFIIVIILLLFEKSFSFNVGLVSLLLSCIQFLPSLNILPLRKFTSEVPFGSIIFFAASMFLAKAVGRYNALDPVALVLFDFFRLGDLSSGYYIWLILIGSMYLHIFFTSTTVYATVMLPLIISLTRIQGMQPDFLALALAFISPIALILPVNTIPNLVFYKEGFFSQAQMIKYGVITSMVIVLIVLVFGSTYWTFINII
jgi:sodium-dependent dicarboxylate transporter 2/3/5